MTRVRQITRIARPDQRAFTLIEIIVVITIIAILSSIALMVGNRVMQTGRINLTKNLLMILDKTQDSYMMDRDGKLPYKWTDTSAQKNEFGIIDGRMNSPIPATIDHGYSEEVAEPSTTFFLLATGESPSVQSTMNGLDSKFVVRAPIDNMPAPLNHDPTNFTKIYTRQSVKPATAIAGESVSGLAVKDPWGNAIRFVHPKFAGGYGRYWDTTTQSLTLGSGANPRDAEFGANITPNSFRLKQNGMDFYAKFRRSYRPFNPTLPPPSPHTAAETGDADEGLCTGSRGYFYSPGPDKDAGTRGDNVYLDAKPQFPPENAKFE